MTDATVLIVDDETALADLYATFLATEYEVRTATSGKEALQKFDDTVDVALLDRRMPNMSGDELLAELRERDSTVQVAMLTAVDPEGDIVDMRFDDYKIKPVDQSDLLGLVEILLKRATYDERSQEYFSLASKRAALEIAGNNDTEEYEQLIERIEEIREDIDTSLDEMSAEGAFSILSDEEE